MFWRVLREANVLEDLAAKGYGVLPAQRGFSISEAKSILRRISIFHATCALIREEHADIFVNLKNGLYYESISTSNDLIYLQIVISFTKQFSLFTKQFSPSNSQCNEKKINAF